MSEVELPSGWSEAIQIWTMYRNKVVAEDHLINHRMSWMLWSEAILYAMWGALETGFLSPSFPDKPPGLILVIAMACVASTGISVAVWTRWSVNAAKEEISFIKEHYQRCHPGLYESKLPKIHGGKKTNANGHITTAWLPLCFLLMQSATLAYSILAYFLHSK